MSAETKAEAQRRIAKALQHIQRAQAELGEAQSLLSSLLGGFTMCKLVGRLYDQVHRGWYRVAALRGSTKIDLDGISGPAFEARQREGGQ